MLHMRPIGISAHQWLLCAAIGVLVACSSSGDGPSRPEAVTSVAVTPTNVSLRPQESASIVATVSTASGAVTNPEVSWTSDNPAVATVSGNGVNASIVGVAPGTTTVRARSGGVEGTVAATVAVATYTLSVTLTGSGSGSVTSSPAGLSCTSGSCSASFPAGQSVVLTAQASNGSILTSWQGTCTGVASCAVTMNAASAVTATFSLEPIDNILVTPASSTLAVGGTVQLQAIARTSDNRILPNRAIQWASSAPSRATVSSSGLVTGIATGANVTITATADGKAGNATIALPEPTASWVGNWVGNVTCLPGTFLATLSIVAGSGNAVEAQLSFAPPTPALAVPSGSYLMRGTVRGDSLVLDANETDWIAQPSGYLTSDLRAVRTSSGTISGSLVGHGCGSVTFVRSTATGGLVAHYPFTGNAQDASGNGFHGTPLNAVLTTDRFGIANRAYAFQGASQISSAIYFPSSTITVSAWIKIREYACWGGILDGFYNKWEFLLNCTEGNRLDFAEWRFPGFFTNRTDTTILALDRWYHVAATVSGTRGQFFVDGLPTGQFTLSDAMLTHPGALLIGHSGSGTSQYFQGAIDEVRLYDRALTSAEVAAICASEAAPGHRCR